MHREALSRKPQSIGNPSKSDNSNSAKSSKSYYSPPIAMDFPVFPLDAVSQLLLTSYGLVTQEVSALPGYDDSNFRISTSQGSVMLKMSPDFRTSEERIPAQLDLMVYLKTTEVGTLISKVVPLQDGRLWAEYSGGWTGRLLEYIEGELVGLVQDPKDSMWFEVGRTIALLDGCLAAYPSPNRFPRSYISMDNVLQTLEDLLEYVTNPHDLACLKCLMSHYAAHTVPLLCRLPRQTVHNDLHDFNLLWHAGKVSGVIDFEDVELGYRLVDLATMAGMAFREGNDVVEAITPLIQGFESELRLTEEEKECLFGFIAMRLCTFAVIASFERVERPGNPYLWVDDDLNWARVRLLASVSPTLFLSKLRATLSK